MKTTMALRFRMWSAVADIASAVDVFAQRAARAIGRALHPVYMRAVRGMSDATDWTGDER